jgi:hypothetical protein
MTNDAVYSLEKSWDTIIQELIVIHPLDVIIQGGGAVDLVLTQYKLLADRIKEETNKFFEAVANLDEDSKIRWWFDRCYDSLSGLERNELKDAKRLLRYTSDKLLELAQFRAVHEEGDKSFWSLRTQQMKEFIKNITDR